MRGSGSIPTMGNILLLEFFCFHAVKTKMPILAFLCVCEKPECVKHEKVLLATIGLSAVQSSTPTLIHNAFPRILTDFKKYNVNIYI